ncbi:hypothetical protein V2J09_006976 [Rumex salicifolius]
MLRSRRGLVVGNYCHDVLLRDGKLIAESLGGAASFISAIISDDCLYVSKVGSDFKYSPPSPPIVSPSSNTTLFHAYFSSDIPSASHSDRVLKRIHACDPILADDLPSSDRFEFGLAVGVAGEILPETLERLLDICDFVFVDVQGLIREFDEIDGSVRLIRVRDSGFYHLLPRIRFLKASSEEAEFIDLDEARQWCSVLVTNGERGCKVYSKEGEVEIPPFVTVQVDPTGAGDSFLAGFVAGIVQGLAVPDAALLGNLFGSLTVGHLGLPVFDSSLLQAVEEEANSRKSQYVDCGEEREKLLVLRKPSGHEEFHSRLFAAVKLASSSPLLLQEIGGLD